MVDNYAIYLERPFLKQFRQAKLFWDLVLIVGSISMAIVIFANNGGSKTAQATIGEVLMAAGLIPVLLSLPLILADWTIGLKQHSSLKRMAQCFCCRDMNLFVAYLFYLVLLIVGMFLLTTVDKMHTEVEAEAGAKEEESNDVLMAFSEVLAEVGIIYFLTTLLGVPSVETDDTKPFLSKDELAQVNRSQTLHAPYAPATDFVLVNACSTRVNCTEDYEEKLHKWMDYSYPEDVDSDYEGVAEQFHGKVEEFGGDGQERELASEILMDTPPGWDSAWYVSALGYCDFEKIPDLIPGLLSFISGAILPKDRYIIQAAITSLGNLYFGTQSRKMSQRLMSMWASHEISNVRDHCAVAIEAIGDPLSVAYLKQLQNLKAMKGCELTEQYYDEFMMQTTPLRAASLSECIQGLIARGSFDIRMMYFVRACDLMDRGVNFSLEELCNFIRVSGERVLTEPLEGHAVKQVCLEAMRRAVIQCKRLMQPFEGSHIQQEVFDNCNWACRTSVFKQVRNAAKDVLEEANYKFLCIYPCFGEAATKKYAKEGFDYEAIGDVLVSNMGNLYYQLAEKVNSWEAPGEVIVQLFDAQEDTMRAVEANCMTKPIDDPVMLLYVYLAECEFPKIQDYHIQERLNAVDRFERYVGLVAIASMRKSMQKIRVQVLPQFTERELISDVRDLAEVVKSGEADTVDPESVLDTMRDSIGSAINGCLSMCVSDSDSVGDKRNAFITEEYELLKKRIANPAQGPPKVSLSPQITQAFLVEDTTPLLGPERPPQSVTQILPVQSSAYITNGYPMGAGNGTYVTSIAPPPAVSLPPMSAATYRPTTVPVRPMSPERFKATGYGGQQMLFANGAV